MSEHNFSSTHCIIAMETALLSIILTLSVLLALKNYGKVSFALSVLFAAPNLILILPVYFVFQTVLWFNKRRLDEGRFTHWYNLSMRFSSVMAVSFDNLFRDFEFAIRHFIGEEAMATQIVKPGTAREFVPKDERDLSEEEQTVFIMKKIPAEKKAKIRDGVVGLSDDGSVEKFKNNQTALRMVLAQFNGWKNVVDGNGGEVDFDSSPKGKLKCFNMLPDEKQDELIDEFGSVGVTGEEEEEEEDEFVEEEDDEDEEDDFF